MMFSSSKHFISLFLILSILIFDNILIQNYQIPVRIIDKKFNNEFNYKELDFVRIDNDLREQSAVNKTKTILSDGPEIYQTLKNLCFFFEDQKYFFRICLFDNVTQHDKSRYFYRSFHALLGVWQEWYTDLDDFGSGFLFYDHGMECQHGFRRKVGVKFECEKQSDRDKDYDDDDDEEFVKVVDVREIKKCVYLIHIQSFIFCDQGTVYSHLDSLGQLEWDLIETLHSSNAISSIDYERYLDTILQNYNLIALKPNQTIESILLHGENVEHFKDNELIVNQYELERCRYELDTLRKRLKAEQSR